MGYMIVMSAGHTHPEVRHTPALVRELKRLLDEPAIKAYMDRPYSVSYSYKIPLTGGSSVSGRIYYIDPDVPVSFRPYILEHERVEKALRDVKGMKYARAHELATVAERLKVEADKRDWVGYKKAIAMPVRSNEKRGQEKLPAGFDLGPYRESGLMDMVKGE